MITFMQMIDINIDITITTAATEATTTTEGNNNNNNNNNNNGAAGEGGEAGEGNNNNNNNPRSLYQAGEFTRGQSWEKLFLEKTLKQVISLADYRDKTSNFCEFLRHVALNFSFCFLFQALTCLETCVKCITKCVKAKFTLLKSKIQAFKKKFKKKLLFNFRLSKTNSFKPSLKSSLGLYVFESLC